VVADQLTSLPYVWSDDHAAHRPDGEIWVGVRTPGTDVPERAERIRVALRRAGALEVAAERHPEERLSAVHDPELLAYLREAWDRWQDSGLTLDPGQNRVVPYLFPHPGLTGALPVRIPVAASARAGRFAYDTMTLIGPGTWRAARSAVDVALTAAELVSAGEPLAYACCRPPGHHATVSAFGGSCYLNNAAVAVTALRGAVAGEGPIAVIDIDAHHGNGTQSIFYADEMVLTGSVHVDPDAGWFPHYLGFASETGTGPGTGANRNLPLMPGAGEGPWLASVEELCVWVAGAGARALVVALGVDAAVGDPESPLQVGASGYREAGRLLGALGLPTVVVQEGGYDLDSIGELVTAALGGLGAGTGQSSAQPEGRRSGAGGSE
jgi:acetoin utilization deacetylase AcuC-like enzyme